jgi:hypothetical protein
VNSAPANGDRNPVGVGKITMNGGTLKLRGGENAAGIGAGYAAGSMTSFVNEIIINGGTITAARPGNQRGFRTRLLHAFVQERVNAKGGAHQYDHRQRWCLLHRTGLDPRMGSVLQL